MNILMSWFMFAFECSMQSVVYFSSFASSYHVLVEKSCLYHENVKDGETEKARNSAQLDEISVRGFQILEFVHFSC